MKKVLLSLLTVLFFATSFHKIKSTEKKFSKNFLKPRTENPLPKESPRSVGSYAEEIYNSINFEHFNQLQSEVFQKAYLGFANLKREGKLNEDSHLLTICDFSLSSTQKRLWVIDLNEKKVVYNSLVAHGKNTGEEFAQKFSNTESSLQSSIGFYVTENTYNGSNGYSLKLLGMDAGYNDAALQRAIVMHGADYVSEDFIKNQKRLGRSWGCPAIPRALAEPIINTIKGKSCLFIYYPDHQYLSSSKWLKTEENI
ncbi:murein L,D-transpeptidase catalytic domain family protein [Chryseobacterium sp. SNU WT5]|uniref:murein L,D-transpeptidase catalytic domain family protein n=1 Tax=Chryseobacterium sp. SNU WT5 TaxID=2594269 RepID=UPI00117C1AF6|nr:murein L,D-transpeptidase catalytic domain family protein [Chryseobacterium sp. SNU WT5]QDP85150.1 murein L,D-transpeptidase catalytic domain family protein [Chryseobacterium sp. SNU WT5]